VIGRQAVQSSCHQSRQIRQVRCTWIDLGAWMVPSLWNGRFSFPPRSPFSASSVALGRKFKFVLFANRHFNKSTIFTLHMGTLATSPRAQTGIIFVVFGAANPHLLHRLRRKLVRIGALLGRSVESGKGWIMITAGHCVRILES